MKIFPRDIIAMVSLVFCFILIALGINHVVSGIAIMVITYYFSKRAYEEKNPEKDLNVKFDKVESEIQKIKEANKLSAKTLPSLQKPNPAHHCLQPNMQVQKVPSLPIITKPIKQGDFKS